MNDPPLFIALKREYFLAFVDGTKDTEYRLYGRRWNKKTCRVGRKVVLSMGYGKTNRATGVITGFEVSDTPCHTEAWKACYPGSRGPAACIRIKLEARQ